MSKAKATLSFTQIGSLIEGKPVTIRLPETLDHVSGQPENVTRTVPGIELELCREPLTRDHYVEYHVTVSDRTIKDVKLDMSLMDKVFGDFDALFESLSKGFDRIFRLPRSK
jgi:hypothetical protein